MTKKAARKAWTKPELRRIGEIKDVSGPDGAGAESNGTRS